MEPRYRQNSWHKFRAVCCPQPACTHCGSRRIRLNLRYCQNSWHKLRAGCCLQPACTHYGSRRRRLDPRYSQNNADLSHRNQYDSFYMDPDGYIWNRGDCQNSWHKLRAGCGLHPACTHYGSGRRRPDPRYSQNNADQSHRNQYNSFYTDPDGYIRNRGECQNSWHELRAGYCLQLACTHCGSRRRHPDPRYSQNNADLSRRNRYDSFS